MYLAVNGSPSVMILFSSACFRHFSHAAVNMCVEPSMCAQTCMHARAYARARTLLGLMVFATADRGAGTEATCRLKLDSPGISQGISGPRILSLGWFGSRKPRTRIVLGSAAGNGPQSEGGWEKGGDAETALSKVRKCRRRTCIHPTCHQNPVHPA